MYQEKIGKLIASRRKEMRLSQEQLAEKLECSNRSVSRWENGKNLPDFDKWNDLEKILGIRIAEHIQGGQGIKEEDLVKLLSTDIEYDFLTDIKTDYISSICKKGYYDILDEDLEEFFPIIRYDISIIMGIAVELKEKGYQIKDIFSNGFGVYFTSDDETSEFSTTLFGIIDEYMHHEDETVVKYTMKMRDIIDEIETEVIEMTEEVIFGEKRDKKYCWMDETQCVRGYAGNEAECVKQAMEQECRNYKIAKND